MEKLKDTLTDLKLTNDEVKRFSEAFKKEEFKKLFREYAEELQDPENKRIYEEELTAMENERGMDVEFINPKPGHVLKTIQNSEKKVFINICQSEKIEKPSVNKSTNGDVRGATWSIPHSFTPPREDLDKKNDRCLVYDVVFNINAYEMGSKNSRFRKMLHDTALEGIEKMFKVSLDKINFKILKLKMKGLPVSTVIRKKRVDFSEKQTELETRDNDPLKFPYPEIKETETTHYNITESKPSDSNGNEFTKPVHKIKYSNDFEMLNYVGDQVQHSTKPTRMIIEIKLPLISSANAIDLDIDSRNLKLTTMKPVKYLLELKLSYPVLSDMGSAKFDKTTKVLRLELPIEQTPDQLMELTENVPSNVSNNLIEECPSTGNEIGEQLPGDARVLSDGIVEDDNSESPNANTDGKENADSDKFTHTNPEFLTKEMTRLDEIERIIPEIELRFRNNSTHAFIVCHIRNIDKSNWNYQWDPISPMKHQVIIAFSNCGQGGWKNFYKLPIVIDFKDEITNVRSEIQCQISEESMVLQVPIQINSTFAKSLGFSNQIFTCKYDDPLNCWNTLCDPEIITELNDNNETFQTAFGVISTETLKIICAPLQSPIDMEKEFPKIVCTVTETYTEIDHHETDQMEMVEGEESVETQETNSKFISEPNENIVNESVIIEKDFPTILPLDYMEAQRNLEHRNNCCVELNVDLLFDLE